MITAPARGAEGRDGARPRTLACTEDGVWLWPATPLTQRRGGALEALPASDLYRLVASLHGPSVHIPRLERAIATAAALLNAGRVTTADEVVTALELPPVSYDGAALMKALGRRLGISLSNVEVGGSPSPSRPALFDEIARVHDGKRAMAQALEGLFDTRFVSTSMAKYNPDQPRDERGRWASEDHATTQQLSAPAQVAQEIVIPGRVPILPRGSTPRFKALRPGISDAEGAKDIPSWARGMRPYVGESGKDYAKRLLDEKYGPENWQKSSPEYNQLRKYGDRNFRDPRSVVVDDDQA